MFQLFGVAGKYLMDLHDPLQRHKNCDLIDQKDMDPISLCP